VIGLLGACALAQLVLCFSVELWLDLCCVSVLSSGSTCVMFQCCALARLVLCYNVELWLDLCGVSALSSGLTCGVFRC